MAENDQKGPVGIRISGGKNVTVKGNVAVGMPILDASNVDGLKAENNLSIMDLPHDPEPTQENEGTPTPAASPSSFRYLKSAFTILGSIIVSLIVAWVTHRLGWNK